MNSSLTEVMAQVQKEQESSPTSSSATLSTRRFSSLERGLDHVLDRLRELVREGERS